MRPFDISSGLASNLGMGMSHAVAVAAALLFSASGLAHADCTCRFKGGKIEEGKTACIDTAKGPSLARCSKFLNTTTWQLLDQPCKPNQTTAALVKTAR
jgi:hypothetical protein